MHGIMVEEVPEYVSMSDFEYLQSKVPSYKELFDDFLKIEVDGIVNTAKNDEKKKRVSELVGVGVGLYYSTEVLNIDKKTIGKIERPNVRIKYQDYNAVANGKLCEIETKGTTYEHNIPPMIEHILEKKSASRNKTAFKFGTVTLLKRENNSDPSKLVVCDDPEKEVFLNDEDIFYSIASHYNFIFSLSMKSIRFNKYQKSLQKIKHEVRINKNIFKGKYIFENKTYYGTYFDKRLIFDKIKNLVDFKDSLKIFNLLTTNEGNEKYFFGVEESIIDYINSKNINLLHEYKSKKWILEENKKEVYLDIDGVIFVKSLDGSDSQIEKSYSDDEVKKILKLMIDYSEGITHKCGAPCRSEDKKGKPCEIKTYASNCHFHI